MKKKVKLIVAAVLVMALSVFAIAGCSGSNGAAGGATEQTITDEFGREVTIPTKVDSVYCAVPTGEATVATMCPDKLIGWVNQPTDSALSYLPDNLASLPVLGGWMGQQVTANIEDIIAADPDVIIYMGTANLASTDVPDQIQQQTNIPVVCVSSALEDTAQAYRDLGNWLGEPERGEKLASYYEEHLADVQKKIDAIPDSERPTVYYAENADGLATDPTGSNHTEVLDYCKVTNVANVEMKGGQGRTDVTIEQVIGWNPDIILCHSGFLLSDSIINNPQWADISAVQNGRVYTTPADPFNWFDRPPNAMRLMGIEWFAKVCYPDIDIDLNTDVKDFCKLFYNVDLTDDQVANLINQDEISFKENAR